VVLVLLAISVGLALGRPNRQALHQTALKPSYVPGELIIKLKKRVGFTGLTKQQGILKTGVSSVDKKNRQFGVTSGERVFKHKPRTRKDLKARQKLGMDRILLLKTSKDANISFLITQYAADPNVEWAEPNRYYYGDATPNDTLFSGQWGLHNDGTNGDNAAGTNSDKKDADVDAPEGWDKIAGTGCVIAILDSGVDFSHPDLNDHIWKNDSDPLDGNDNDSNGYTDDYRGWNFVNDNNNPADDHGHGTAVAGIAAAETNNSQGIAGADWTAKIMVVKVLNSNLSGTTVSVADGIDYAANKGADVINMSFGNYKKDKYGPDSTVKSSIQNAYDNKGCILVATMGNDNQEKKRWPAAYDKVLAVGATDSGDWRCAPDDWGSGNGSNYGNWIDVVAPGRKIYTTKKDGGYTSWTGTSFAAPLVSGLASLIKGSQSGLKNSDVYKRIRSSAEDKVGNSAEDIAGFDKYYGYGRINFDLALPEFVGGPWVIYPVSPTYVEGSDGSALYVPTGAVTESTQVSFASLESAPPPPSGYTRVSAAYEFTPSGQSFLELVTITLPYQATADPNRIDVFWYNDSTSVWERITTGRSINQVDRTISIKTDHFSLYGVMEQQPVVPATSAWSLLVLLLVGVVYLYRKITAL
jgi:subtilisin family serine protease